MMTRLGHEVILYSNELNEANATEHVPIFTEALRAGLYGDGNQLGLFGGITWDEGDTIWKSWCQKALAEVRERAQDHEPLLLTAPAHSLVAEGMPNMTHVEWAVGYERIWAPFRIFESYAWMHREYGHLGIPHGAPFDAVIPNFFDERDFTATLERGDYLLFLGRMIWNKGVGHAIEIAQQMGIPLITAGPGVTYYNEKKGIMKSSSLDVKTPGVFQHVGVVDLEQRRELLGRAKAVLMPTQYIEPFGGVAVEAMMSGAPVIASDWGAFTEIVEPGVTGYRFRTLKEACEAVEASQKLNPDFIRSRAIGRFSLDSVGPQFAKAFDRMGQMWDKGWYQV